MRKNLDTSRAGMIVFLGVLLGAIWLLIAFSTYHEAQRQKIMVSIHPGSVAYGTHSTAVVPMVSAPMHRSSVPMISGNAVRSYAYSGHATMPGTSSGNSGYKLHTLSSATLHSIGGGGSGGGGSMSGGSTSSSRGINYSGSFAMPTLAMATPVRSTSSNQIGMSTRWKAKPTYDGYDGQEVVDDEDGTTIWTYSEDAEDWFNTTPTGTKRYDSVHGYMVEWNGTEWVKVGDQGEPGVPIGDAPWHWMLLMIAVYAVVKSICKKQNAI